MTCLATPMLPMTGANRDGYPSHTEASAMCALSILAEASLEQVPEAKRARTGSPLPGTPIAELKCYEAVECSEVAAASECTTRCPSPTTNDGTFRSRSTSPNSGKSYACNHCNRAYASTDAVRKHARQNHPEWLKAQGLGCPSLYCTLIEPNAEKNTTPVKLAVATAVVAAPAVAKPVQAVYCGVMSATPFKPPIMAVAAPNPNPPAPIAPRLAVTIAPESAVPPSPMVPPSPADPSAALLLMTAAESCHALSMAAHENEEEAEEADESFVAALLASRELWPGAHAPSAAPRGAPPIARKNSGTKRPRAPRTVRCGNCDGCVRAECGNCKNCVDMPRFGGPGARKQGCVFKVCGQPRVHAA